MVLVLMLAAAVVVAALMLLLLLLTNAPAATVAAALETFGDGDGETPLLDTSRPAAGGRASGF